MRDPYERNRRAWNRRAQLQHRWTIPVTSEQIDRARRGDWEIVLTPVRPVPKAWLEPLAGTPTLALASGGGQQGPILAAAGAHVTVFDASEEQLARDRMVADRDGLELSTVQGDMRDLSRFEDASFDLIVHPVSNCFVDDVRVVWRECARVLKPGGRLLAGFGNPALYIFDVPAYEAGGLVVRHRVPYSDYDAFTAEEIDARAERGEPVEFGHTLEDQIAGQLAAGLTVTGLYEDVDGTEPATGTLGRYLPCFIATQAIKPR